MTIEVEQKYRISDVPALERQLNALGARRQQTVDQVDCYFGHPARDFSATDEALRLRQVGRLNYITYKGPKIDATTKSRREIEIALADGDQAASDAASLLVALGCTPVAQVYKRRVHFTVDWQGRETGIALDQVVELGNFIELEIVVPEEDIAQARDCIISLASRLGLSNGERRSYLELLLVQRKAPVDD
jgi:adenylate cyclase class 2